MSSPVGRCRQGLKDDTTRGEKLRATGVMNEGSVRGKQEVVMKLTSVKSMVMKGVTVGLVVGAVVLAAPAESQAQQFAGGGRFGSPGYGYCRNGAHLTRHGDEGLCRQV